MGSFENAVHALLAPLISTPADHVAPPLVDWLKKIFDPKTHPCFRDEFIHPNELVPLMRETRENFGLRGYTATGPG